MAVKRDEKQLLIELTELRNTLKETKSVIDKLEINKRIEKYKKMLNEVQKQEEVSLNNINIKALRISFVNYMVARKKYPELFEKESTILLDDIKQLYTYDEQSNKEYNNVFAINENKKLFKGLDPKFKSTYDNLVNKNKIYFNESDNNKQYGYHLLNNKDSYILINSTNKFDDTYVLSHEVFHAIDMEMNDYVDNNTNTRHILAETPSYLSSFLLKDKYNGNILLNDDSNEAFIRIYNSICIKSKLCLNQLKLYDYFEREKGVSINDFNVLFKDNTLNEKYNVLNKKYSTLYSNIYSYFTSLEFYKQYKDNDKECIKNIKNLILSTNNYSIRRTLQSCDIDRYDIGSEKSKILLKTIITK